MGITKKNITDKEFNLALENRDNINIIKAVTNKYSKVLPKTELENCGLRGLWKTLEYHDEKYGQKFTSSLWRFTQWECNKELKKNNKIKFHSLKTDTPEYNSLVDNGRSVDCVHIKECLERIPKFYRNLIYSYYYERKKIREISNELNISTQQISFKLKYGLKLLKKFFKEK